jgi:hypothetical protein
VAAAEKVHPVTKVAPLPIAVMEERAPLQQLLAHRLLTQPEVVGQPLASVAFLEWAAHQLAEMVQKKIVRQRRREQTKQARAVEAVMEHLERAALEL